MNTSEYKIGDLFLSALGTSLGIITGHIRNNVDGRVYAYEIDWLQYKQSSGTINAELMPKLIKLYKEKFEDADRA